MNAINPLENVDILWTIENWTDEQIKEEIVCLQVAMDFRLIWDKMSDDEKDAAMITAEVYQK